MTPAQAAGYLAGAGVGFLRRHHEIFAVLLATAGLGFILTSLRLSITPTRFVATFGDGASIGALMLAIGVVLYLLCRSTRR